VLTALQIALAQIYKLRPEILQHFTLEMAHDRPWKTGNSFFTKQSDVVVKVARRLDLVQ
jgi:hypothetical protein